ncbi:aminopeptidase N [bacterium]|nr:aminopeptidase N [bacterium]
MTQAEATDRARRVSNVGYTLHLDLQAKSETYRGKLTASFDVAGPTSGLWIDFTGKTIRSLTVNGSRVEAPEWNKHRIALPAELLARKNEATVEYENDYSHTGSGFHHFNDPEDGREYAFSDFEPFNAHQLFPCFDQPDLKATYTVSVTAPGSWVVVANGRELEAKPVLSPVEGPAGAGRTTHFYEKTKPFSTYLMAVIAGEFAVYKDQAGTVPLRILCRQALTKHIDPEEIFTVTKQGFAFYDEYFDFPYPFVKYDQAFVPEFNAGAMENVGAVTHAEHMIFRGQVSETQRLGRAETVLHELAHMWFGDLVTMRWWKDLWLNESFATFISYVCMTNATRFKDAWESFRSKIKAWAYRQDELVTTHPIAGEVPDTDATFLNFDGITYGKGASVLKQLTAYMGATAFRDGLRRYFKKHAWSNTTLDDFLAALEQGSGKDLVAWSKLWIETAGLGSLSPSFTLKNGRIESFEIVQESAPQNSVLRPHRTEVALFEDDGKGAVPSEVVSVLVEGKKTTVRELAGKPAPAFVTVNHGDHAYAKVVFDKQSLSFVREHLERIQEPLVVVSLWGTLWQMVRDQKLPAFDWVELVASKSQHATSPEVVETLLGNGALALVRYVGVGTPLEATGRRLLVERCWSRLDETKGDLQLAWLRGTIMLAAASADLDRLVRLMDGFEKIAGVEIDQNMRWSLIAKLIGFGRPTAEDRLKAELVRDPSDKGKKSAFQAEASRPSREEKERHWRLFTSAGGVGGAHSAPQEVLADDFLKNGMSRFHWAHQQALLDPYVDRFFEAAPAIYEGRNREYAKSFVLLLYPTYRAERAVLAKGEALLGKVTIPGLVRLLKESNDELARSIRCREYQASSRRS